MIGVPFRKSPHPEQAPSARRTVVTKVAGLTLTVHPTVFNPKVFRSSAFLARHIARLDVRGKKVADMGTGTGILGIVAAKQGAAVTMVDINPLACEAARENAERNGVAVRVIQSDWFEALHGETFDVIVCNPPHAPGNGSHPHAAAFHAGEMHENVAGLVEGCDDHLVPGGEAHIVVSRAEEVDWWMNELAAEGLEPAIVAERRTFTSHLRIIRAIA